MPKKGKPRKTAKDAPPDGRQARRMQRDLSPPAPSDKASAASEEPAARPSVGILEDRIVEMIMKSGNRCFLDDLMIFCSTLLQSDLKSSVALVAAVLSRPTTGGESFRLEVSDGGRIVVAVGPKQSLPTAPCTQAGGQPPGHSRVRQPKASGEDAAQKALDRCVESIADGYDPALLPDDDFLNSSP